MSGDRHRRTDKLTGGLRKKLVAALLPVVKNMTVGEVETEFHSELLQKNLNVPCVTQEKDYVPKPPKLVNPLDEWRKSNVILHEMPLIEEALEFQHEECAFEAVIQYETPISETETRCNTVTFDNIRKAKLRERQFKIKKPAFAKGQTLPVTTIETSHNKVDIPKIEKVPLRERTVGKFRCRQDKMPGKYWALPIKKRPLSAIKLPLDLRDKMRAALSEKAGTPTSNIEIKVVYEYMDMPSVANIDQDDQGNLMCFPKPDAIRALKLSNMLGSKSIEMNYLIFGSRIDTKEIIRALLPMELE